MASERCLPLLVAQPPSYTFGGGAPGGGVTRMVDQAPFAETWRILLPEQVKGVQYRRVLLQEEIILSEGN